MSKRKAKSSKPSTVEPPVERLWYVIRTAPRFVSTLYEQCQHVGVSLYYPVYARRVRPARSRQKRVVYRPAFPGYAFVPAEQAPNMRRLPHFRYQFLRSGPEHFIYLTDDVIQDIAEREAHWCQFEVDPKPIDRFKVGDKVKVSGDLFMGPMEVVGFVGSTVKLAYEGTEIRADPAILQRVDKQTLTTPNI